MKEHKPTFGGDFSDVSLNHAILTMLYHTKEVHHLIVFLNFCLESNIGKPAIVSVVSLNSDIVI